MTVLPPRKKRNTGQISTSTITAKHPLNVKPAGNALLFTTKELAEQRRNSLGFFDMLSDDLILDILGLLDDPKDLLGLSATSKVMYAFTYDEDLWRKLYMRLSAKEKNAGDYPLGIDTWRGSWRCTLLGIDDDKEAKIQLTEGLLCSDLLFRPFQCANVDYKSLFKDLITEERLSYEEGETRNKRYGIERISESDLSQEMFDDEYYLRPFILTKKDDKRWPAWDVDYLVKRFPNVRFRQESVQWPLSFYYQYFQSNKDESPLYLFDCQSTAIKQLSDEYTVPSIFQHDFFSLLQQGSINTRPDHRWIIIGPANSGSTFHKDPNSTSAWNANLSGLKLWVMTESGVKPPGIDTDATESEVTSPVGVAEWTLSGFYNDSLKLAQQGKCLIGLTFPGEVMYVPSGWWHTVINLEDSVALTQNFIPKGNLSNVLGFLRDKREQISGFHIGEFVRSLRAHLKCHKDNEYNEVFQQFLTRVGELEDDEEDIGEMKLCDELQLPIFEFFSELIRSNAKYGLYLQKALADLKDRELKERREASTVVPSKKWESLTESATASESPFSFNFEESDDE